MTASVIPARPPRIPKTPPPEVVTSARIENLRVRLAAAGGQAPGIVAAFWAEVANLGTPLVEAPWAESPHDRAVTFLWRDRRGTATDTRTVVLLANKVTDPSVWEESQLHRIAGTDIWHRTYRLPSDWQGTFQLAPDDEPETVSCTGGPVHGPRSRWAGVATIAVADPFCRVSLAGKPGELPSSVGILEHAPPQPWRARRAGVPRGSLTEAVVPSERLTEPRRVWVYTPAMAGSTGAARAADRAIGQAARAASPTLAATPADHDLLILLDGEDWAGRLDLTTTLDNLIADGLIPPTVAVLVDAIDTPTRWQELTCNAGFTDFLIQDVLPWARRELPASADPQRTTISGRSLGALTALYAGLRAPEQFGAVHGQSASLWWPAKADGDRRPGWLVDELLAAAALPPRICLEVGRQEWMLLEPGRELARALAARGDVRASLVEYEGGHDAWCWRGGLGDTLAALHAAPR